MQWNAGNSSLLSKPATKEPQQSHHANYGDLYTISKVWSFFEHPSYSNRLMESLKIHSHLISCKAMWQFIHDDSVLIIFLIKLNLAKWHNANLPKSDTYDPVRDGNVQLRDCLLVCYTVGTHPWYHKSRWEDLTGILKMSVNSLFGMNAQWHIKNCLRLLIDHCEILVETFNHLGIHWYCMQEILGKHCL